MKTILTLIISMICSVAVCQVQVQEVELKFKKIESEENVQPVQNDTVSQSNEITVPFTRTREETETLLAAYRTKVEAIRSNSEEHKKATENGWYDRMNARIEILESRLTKNK